MQTHMMLTYFRLKKEDSNSHFVFILNSFCIKHTKAAKIGKSLYMQ